jgi:hypothetical protein
MFRCYSAPVFSFACISEGTEIGASGKMLSLTKQDNDARLFRRIAKKCLEKRSSLRPG